jgi:negative regulator of genetic competence, sporulation and motility
MAETLEHVTIKIFDIVDRDFLRDAVTTDNILLEEFFFIVVEVMLVTHFASTHFVKYSTAIMAKV